MITALVLAALAQDPAPAQSRAFEAPTEDGSLLPCLVRGADDRVYLSWVQRHGRTSGTLLVSAWDGTRWSQPQEVGQGERWFLNWTDFPKVGALADGTLLATWLERLGEATYAYGVRFSLSQGGGAGWSEARWLHEDRSPVEHGFVSIVAVDADTFGLVWLDGRGLAGDEQDHGEPAHGTQGHGPGATALYFRTLDREGRLGDERQLDARVCDCCPTSLVRAGSDELAVAYRDRSEAEIRDVSVRRRSASGWSDAVPLHADGWEMPGCPVNGPRLVAHEGRLAGAWYTGAGEGGGRVLVALQDERGFGPPIRVDDGAPEGRVDAVFLDDGSLVVAWLEHEEGRATWRVRRVAAGVPVEASIELAEVDGARSSGLVRLVADGDGVLAAWTAPGPRVETARVTLP